MVAKTDIATTNNMDQNSPVTSSDSPSPPLRRTAKCFNLRTLLEPVRKAQSPQLEPHSPASSASSTPVPCHATLVPHDPPTPPKSPWEDGRRLDIRLVDEKLKAWREFQVAYDAVRDLGYEKAESRRSIDLTEGETQSERANEEQGEHGLREDGRMDETRQEHTYEVSADVGRGRGLRGGGRGRTIWGLSLLR